jgi:hypothetical protein
LFFHVIYFSKYEIWQGKLVVSKWRTGRSTDLWWELCCIYLLWSVPSYKACSFLLCAVCCVLWVETLLPQHTVCSQYLVLPLAEYWQQLHAQLWCLIAVRYCKGIHLYTVNKYICSVRFVDSSYCTVTITIPLLLYKPVNHKQLGTVPFATDVRTTKESEEECSSSIVVRFLPL